MARRIKWTAAAWSDLEEAADYIARDSPNYAAAMVREVREAARLLSRLAERGRMVPEFREPAIRQLLVGNYRLIYQVSKDTVDILALVHGARDLRALWEQEDREADEE
jgi:toxin ParE1/3/4